MKQLFENELYTKPFLTIQSSSSFPLHYHRHIEIAYVMDGNIGVQVDGSNFLLKRGDAIFVPPFIFHSYTKLDDNDVVLFKAIMEPECLGILGDILSKYHPTIHMVKASELEAYFPDTAKRLQNLETRINSIDAYCGYPKYYAELISFIKSLMKCTGIKEFIDSSSGVFLKAVQMCHDNYSDPDFCIDSMTDTLYISRTRLQQLFANHLNLGIKEYITLLRMSKAESLLGETDTTIKEIACLCGYNSVRSFNRAFFNMHNETPSEYRINFRANPSLEKNRKILSNFELFYNIH